jgi:hypothetical protein
MNCDWVKENITLYLYGELADDARHELEQHAARCQSCATELADQRVFQEQLSALPMVEPSPSFLAASRMRLQEALEGIEPRQAWYHRFAFDPAAWFRQIRFSPALATIIFLVGFGGGIGAMYRAARGGPAASPVAVDSKKPDYATISGITSIERKPGSDEVEVHFNRVLPDSMRGSVNDPQILGMLRSTAQNNDNLGLRLGSIDALIAKSDELPVRETLTYTLRYDNNPGLRLRALEGLAPYVKQDIRVRNAVVNALLDDSNLGVRGGAMRALEPVLADSSVRMALQLSAKEDPSAYIRNESKNALASMPNIY